MNLLFTNPEAASPAPAFTANCEPTLDEILEEPIIRQLMASDSVTEATLRRFADGMGESLVSTGGSQDRRPDGLLRCPSRPERAWDQKGGYGAGLARSANIS
jgi:hypothetical protein